MGWRTVIVESTAKLDYKLGYLVIRTKDRIKRIYIKEISVVVFESTSISLTAYLLCELAEEKVLIVFCDQKRIPHGLYTPLYGCHDVSDKIRKQMNWDSTTKDNIWSTIVSNKIRSQATLLKKSGKNEDSAKLNEFMQQVDVGDSTNREGHAAKVYFNRMFGLEFTRSDDSNPINAELNYGYSILLSAVSREVVVNGYLTQVGLHHDNKFNYFNLSSDLMEPFRVFVDEIVITLDHKELSKSVKHTIIEILNKKVHIANKEQFLLNALNIYVKSVFDAFEQQNPSIICFPNYELSIYESNSNV